MAIGIKSLHEIDALKKPNAIVAKALDLATKSVKEGMSLLELDKIIEDFILSCGAKPAFKGLYNFPNASCLSVNEVVIHGIPSEYKLKKGDVVGIDVGAEYEGWFGDGAITIGVDEIGTKDLALIACAKNVLEDSIDFIRAGMHFKELCKFLENKIKDDGFVPLKGFCGHGIGRKPHEEPEIPNYLESSNVKQGPKIRDGMVFCIEPMVCQESGESRVLSDNWSVVSKDGLNTSHYEHTVAIIGGRAEILTRF